jgi:hypothetical protein
VAGTFLQAAKHKPVFLNTIDGAARAGLLFIEEN